MNLHEAFEKFNSDYTEFEKVEDKLHARPDLCAFLLLDNLLPRPGRDLIAAAEHDEIFLSVDCDELAKVVTEADVLMLTRCGVRFSARDNCLVMFT